MPGVFSYAQLEGLWVNAGGDASTAPTAAAVSEAESSGNEDATSSNPDGGTNVGLWQLDTPGGKGAGYTVAQLEDPATNALVAVKGSADGTDFSAWQTYVQGTYLQFLDPSVKPDTNVAKPAGGTAATTTSGWQWWNPLSWTPGNAASSAGSALGSALAPVGKTIGHYVADGLLVVAGVGLVIWGIGRTTGTGRKVEQQVQADAPAIALAGGV